MSIGDYLEPRILDAVFNNTSLAIASTFIKLHTGDPGETGTANAAGETTRKAASWAAASGGTIATDTTLTWTSVSTIETYTYISVWDNVSAGNHLWNGALDVPYAVATGDSFVLPSGLVVCTLD